MLDNNNNNNDQLFSLQLNYLISNVREKDYVNFYKSRYFEVYKYVSFTFLDLLLERQQSLTLLVRIYEHQYSYAKTQAFVNRLCNSYIKIINKTNM